MTEDQIKILSALVTRSSYAAQLGMSFGGDRDLYEALGYKKELTYTDYLARFKRGDICKRLINAPIDSTWRNPPEIVEGGKDDGEDSPFETAWKELAKRLDLWEQFRRVDRLTGLGQYGVLYLGYNVPNASQPLPRNANLLYVHPYSEQSATIQRWEEDITNPRFGLPTLYNISFATADKKGVSTRPVHHTRVLHIVDDPLENAVYGTPRLEAVFNRLQDLEKVVGGSGEMFWKGARPGYSAEAHPEARFTPEVSEALEEQFDEFEHKLRRFLQIQGLNIKSLAPQVTSPTDHMWVNLELIAGTEGIPLRILIGSERGELASSQDEKNWKERIEERMKQYAEPVILRPFIDRCIATGVLPEPVEGYEIAWPKLWSPGDKEQADISEVRSRAIATYANSPAPDIIPPEIFLRVIMSMTPEQVEQIEATVGEYQREDREDVEE